MPTVEILNKTTIGEVVFFAGTKTVDDETAAKLLAAGAVLVEEQPEPVPGEPAPIKERRVPRVVHHRKKSAQVAKKPESKESE